MKIALILADVTLNFRVGDSTVMANGSTQDTSWQGSPKPSSRRQEPDQAVIDVQRKYIVLRSTSIQKYFLHVQYYSSSILDFNLSSSYPVYVMIRKDMLLMMLFCLSSAEAVLQSQVYNSASAHGSNTATEDIM